VRAFHEGVGEVGFVEGRNVTVHYRWAEGDYHRLSGLAVDLARTGVAVIAAAGGTAPALAAKAATKTTPIVFQIGSDPVRAGLVESLNRPAGNLTGVSTLTAEVGPKRLELLRELVPTATMIAVLINPTSPNAEAQALKAEASARTLGVQVRPVYASTDHDLDKAFSTIQALGAGALSIAPDPFLNSRSEYLASLAQRMALPAIFHVREFAVAGGAMSYGGSNRDAYRKVGTYCGRIIRGAKPSDLPVEQSTRAELVINLKTANTLGITVPTPLLARADEVIE
jgi:putative ABC transport system substrate-binding protein